MADFVIWLLMLGCSGALGNSLPFAISPASLEFESRLDEPTLLTLDVGIESLRPADVSVEIEGFRCDRKTVALNDAKLRIQIAPNTLVPGAIQGRVIVKSNGLIVGGPIPVSGIVRPWVKVQPNRLFIGSVGKGEAFDKPQTYTISLTSDNAPFDIISVEFQGIDGARWDCNPKAGVPSQKRELKLTFSPDALAAGIPYGALAKKAIIIRTSHPNAPDVVIPAAAMISVNTTGRDYSQYLYNGEVRWQGPWGTPNIAATFLATATILLCGIGGFFHSLLSKRPRCQVILAVLVLIVMALGSYFLSKTYSRGGWVAAAVGIGLLLVCIRSYRFYPVGLACFFALAIALHPSGLQRAASSTKIGEDKSVLHRIYLWEGSLQMMAEHPWTGVGSGKFGDIFKKDYQRPTHTAENSTAVNDYLTFGTEHGIPLLALAVSVMLYLVGVGISVGFKEKNAFLLSCAASALCFLTCSWFSSIAFAWNPSFLLIASLVGITGMLAWREFRTQRSDKVSRMARGLVAWVAMAVVIFGVCFAAGWLASRSRPVSSLLNISGMSGVKLSPRNSPPKGTLLYISDSGDFLAPEKNILRPLAQKGWTVIWFPPLPFASDSYQKMHGLIEELRKSGILSDNWCIAGHRQGAQLALALAAVTKPMAVSCYLTPTASPFSEQSTVTQVTKIQCPLLLGAQDADPLRSSQHLSQIVCAAQAVGLTTRQQTYRGEFSQESPRWQQWIEDIDDFATNQRIKK